MKKKHTNWIGSNSQIAKYSCYGKCASYLCDILIFKQY